MEYDIIIIGGGIVGISTAYNILQKRPGTRLLLLEKERKLGQHQTGNNSGVIHSGIYYKPGSLKALNCREGYKMLLDFCEETGIDYEICGKIIVATKEEEVAMLHTLMERGQANGLEGLQYLNREQIREIEPHVKGIKGIKVPETGIIDYKVVVEKLADIVSKGGGEIRLQSKVAKIIESENGVEVITTDEKSFQAKLLVTCAGLHSDHMARMMEKHLPIRIIPFRGEYYKLVPEKRNLVKNLIYPVPNPQFPFLGVHFTRMVNGEVEAGPNAVLALGREAYHKSNVNLKDLLETLAWPGFHKVAVKYWKEGMEEFYRSFSKKAFVKSLQNLIPEVEGHDLIDGGSGIRAQACHRDGSLLDDFYIMEGKRQVHVCNAPSPAATSSLSIGKRISQRLLGRLS